MDSMLKIIIVFLMLLLFVIPAQAVTLTGDIDFQKSGYTITITDQTADKIISDSSGLNISINDSYSIYSSTANLSLSNITYQSNHWSFSGEATAGTMGVRAKVSQASGIPYRFFVDGVDTQNALVNASLVVLFFYSGWSSHTFQIMQAAFDVVTDPSSSVSSQSATLNGEYVSASQPVTVYFEYSGSSGSYKYRTTPQGAASNGTFLKAVSGAPLISNKKYYYRAVANNGTQTVYGNQESFTMSSLTPILDYDFDKNFDDLVNSTLEPVNMTQVGASAYVDRIGSIFWGIVFAIIFMMLWLRSEDITIPALVGLIVGGSLWAFMPADWVSLAMSLTVVSFGGLMYSLLKGRS